jgi:hypothetical protein
MAGILQNKIREGNTIFLNYDFPELNIPCALLQNATAMAENP